jgi:hypothetical protein
MAVMLVANSRKCCYNQHVFRRIVAEYFTGKSQVVKLYYSTRTTPVLTRLDVRVFYECELNKKPAEAGFLIAFEKPCSD